MTDLCPICADWPVGPQDVFCGGCGGFVAAAKVVLVEKPTGTGAAICLRVESAREELRKVPFAVIDPDGDMEIGRARPGEFPEGMLVPLAHGRDYGLSVHAVAGFGEGGGRVAPNSLHVAAVQRATATSQPSLRLAEPTVDFAAARPTRRGWHALAVEVVNAGPPVVLGGARLRVDGEPSGDEDPDDRPLEPPILLGSGRSAVFDAWISQNELDGLSRSSRPRTGTVDFAVHSLDGGIGRTTVVGRLGLFRACEPSMKVALAWRVRGRAGQRARVGALLTNTGGAVLRVESIEFAYGGTLLAVPMPLEWRLPLAPGDEAPAELRPAFPPEAGEDNVVLKVTAVAENSAETLVAEAARSAEVTPAEAVFRGSICIDFGTSESGAAALSRGEVQPIVVDLGRVPLQQRPEAQEDRDRLGRFLPTVVAEMKDGTFRTGGDAASLVRALQMAAKGHPWPADLERPKGMAAEFKWKLDDHQADGGARGGQLAAAYLSTVKELIENHPEIAASIDRSTPIVATRPTVFDDGRSERLVEAFVAAGFGEPRVTLPSGERTLIAESWAPLPFVLQRSNLSAGELATAMLPLDRGLTLRAIVEPSHPDREGASAWLLVCDVGAGSADFSVVEIIPQRGRQLLRERDSHTDLEFVGRRFRNLIGEVLIDWAADRWTERGRPLRDRPGFAFQIGAREDSPPAARAAFEAAIQALQFDPGLLSGGGFPVALQEGIRDDEVEKAVEKAFGRNGPARKAARAYLPLELQAPGGETILIDSDNLATLVADIVEAFLTIYRDRVVGMIDELVDRSGLAVYLAGREAEVAARHVRIVPSGRGTAFVPAKALLRSAVARLTKQQASLGVLSPVASKSITSWGGLKLAAALEKEMAAFRIDLGGRPLRPRVIVGLDIDSEPRCVEFQTGADGAFIDLATVAEQHVDIETAGSLTVRTGPEEDAAEHVVPLDGAMVAAPEGWWLCAVRHGLRVVVELVAAPSGAEALATLQTQEGTPA